MTKLIKILLGGILILSAGITVAAPIEKPTVKVGVILPLSGDNEHLGQPIRELIQYKVDHFPKNSRFNYKVLFEDDQLIPKQTLLAAHRLVDLENVDVLMTFFTGPGSVVAPYAAQKHKVHLMFNFKEEVADAKYNFIRVTPVDDAVQYWLKHARKLGYKKIAFLVHRNAGGEMVLRSFEKGRESSGLDYVDISRYNQGELDFRIALWKIREKNPDMLFVYGFEPELPIILRQMREIGWKVPMSSIGCFEIYPKDPGLEGAWDVSFSSPSAKMYEWYKSVFYKDAPLGIDVYNDWMDLVYWGFEGSKTAGKPAGEEFAEFLRGIKEPTDATGTIAMDSRGIFRMPPSIKVIKNGVPVPLDK